MIIDCFTHAWDSSRLLGRCLPAPQSKPIGRLSNSAPLDAAPARHLQAADPVDRTIVLGFKSHYLGAEIPNQQVASYVNDHADRLIGFAGVDPAHPKEALQELRRSREELGLRGLSIAPAAQDFHPCDSQAMLVYAEAADSGMPIMFHTGVFLAPETKMEYAQPMLLDAVARDLPNLKIVIAHLGFPWVQETLTLLTKHPNVYAEISWLAQQPWQAYQALLAASQLGVIDKLLFGSGFPLAPASLCIEALYSLNHLVQATNLAAIPREQIRGVVERDALSLLGLATERDVSARIRDAALAEEEEFEPA